MYSNRAVVLISGGIDSLVVLNRVLMEKKKVYGLTFDYGQNREELGSASRLSKLCHAWRLWALPHMKSELESTTNLIPNRNALFLYAAACYAFTRECRTIWIGCNLDDYNDYPDCRPEYLMSMNREFAFNGMPSICAPLLDMHKSEIIAEARKFNLSIESTSSCYQPIDNKPCNVCNACRLRNEALQS